METLTAAVVLAWIVLIVLAFAMAGLLRQLRDLQAALVRQHTSGAAGAAVRELPESVRPENGKTHSVVLLVDDHCPICAEIAPVFAGLAEAGHVEVDFVVLSYSTNEKWVALDNIRYLPDAEAYHFLDPGWQPAVVVVGPNGEVLAAEPAGSEEAVRSVIGNIATTHLTNS